MGRIVLSLQLAKTEDYILTPYTLHFRPRIENFSPNSILRGTILCCLASLACSRLSVSGGLKKQAGNEWGLVWPSPFLSRIPLAAEPACRRLAFSMVLADREPGTGYASRASSLGWLVGNKL